MGRGGDVTWWRVREGGGGVSVDDVVVFKRAELITELQRFGYGNCMYTRMHICTKNSIIYPLDNHRCHLWGQWKSNLLVACAALFSLFIHVPYVPQLLMCHLYCVWDPVMVMCGCWSTPLSCVVSV